jgi:hypothetical protein
MKICEKTLITLFVLTFLFILTSIDASKAIADDQKNPLASLEKTGENTQKATGDSKNGADLQNPALSALLDKLIKDLEGIVAELQKLVDANKPKSYGTMAVDGTANIRSTGSTTGSIVDTITYGEKVQILGKKNGWYKVKTDKATGWVSAKSLKLEETKKKPAAGKKPAPKDEKGSGKDATGIAKKIVAEANKQLGTKKYQSSITEYGNLACAAYVSGVLKACGVLPSIIYNVDGVKAALTKKNWKKVPLKQAQAGDIIIWGPYPGGQHGHIGIFAEKKGGTWYTCDNSSSAKVPKKRPLVTNRPIVCVLRAPGA